MPRPRQQYHMERPEPRRPNATAWRSVPPRGTWLVWDGPLSPHNRYATSLVPWTTDITSAPPRGVIDGIGPEEKVFWMFHAVGEAGAAFRARVWGVREPERAGLPWIGQFHFEVRLILGDPMLRPGFGGFKPGTRFAHHAEVINDQVPFPGATLIGGEENSIELWHEADEWSTYILEMGPDTPGSAEAHASGAHTFGAWWRAFWRPPPRTNAELRAEAEESDRIFRQQFMGEGADIPDDEDAGEQWKRDGGDEPEDE